MSEYKLKFTPLAGHMAGIFFRRLSNDMGDVWYEVRERTSQSPDAEYYRVTEFINETKARQYFDLLTGKLKNI